MILIIFATSESDSKSIPRSLYARRYEIAPRTRSMMIIKIRSRPKEAILSQTGAYFRSFEFEADVGCIIIIRTLINYFVKKRI